MTHSTVIRARQKSLNNATSIVRQGASLPFFFEVNPEETDTASGWIATLVVKEFASDVALIERVVDGTSDTTWEGFLTSTETAGLASDTTYRIVGILTNADTDEEQQQISRFSITESWATPTTTAAPDPGPQNGNPR